MPTYTILQRYLYRGNKTWYGRINDGGKVSYCTLKTKRKADAQAWLDMKNAERFLPKKEESRHDLAKALNEYVELKEKILVGTDTANEYGKKTKRFKAWAEDRGLLFVEDVSPEKAQDFVNGCNGVLSTLTTHQYVIFLRSFFRHVIRKYGMDRSNPFDGVELPKVVKRAKEFWLPEEIDRILDNAQSPGLRLEWSFMAFAGLRRHEAYKVTDGDIVDGLLRVVGKGNKEAFVPVSDRLRKEIDRAGGVIHDGRSIAEKQRLLKDAAERAGLTGEAHPHKFRHSFVSNLIRAKVDAKRVQVLARHSQITTTLNVYSHLLQEDLKEAVNTLK